ncbi:MAG: efflux RND transporter permease subunit [Bacteroidales bacterium]|nr:efflux RND transporter permease subunit [Bacteroidales bacterium]
MAILPHKKGVAGWVQWTIMQKKIVYVIVACLCALGIFGVSRMNKDEFPTFEIKQGLVVGIYPGATAAEVETQLAKPLEQTLFSFKEVIRSTTHSVCRDGVCYIYADLNSPQSKRDEVWSKIKLRLQQQKQLLPSGVLAVAVLDDFSSLSAIMLAIQSPDKGYGELEEIADRLSDRLRRINKLSSISKIGTRPEEIAVLVDRDRVSAYGLDPATLLIDYQTTGMAVLDGSFDAGYTAAPIHVDPSVTGEQEVADRIVWADPSGNVIRLKDIARIERRYQSATEEVTYNGVPCVVLSLEMRPDNDITAFGREVDRVLEEFRSELPDSVTLTKVTDQPRVVGESVFNFLRDLVIAMLVVIAVMLMLFPLKSALIASSGLPVITAMTLCVMYLTGIDLNTVTLAALIVCLGMIVDDSIITMDGYMDKLRRGMTRTDAACASARELFMPTFIATLAISLMFFPIKIILSGYMKDFVKFFPWVILIALMLSLVYAVSVVPALETRYIHEPHRGDENLVARLQSRLFGFIDGTYAKAQLWCFRNPRITLCAAVVAVGLGVFMFSRLNLQMIPKAARDFFVVEVDLEAGGNLDRTREVTDSLESLLLSDRRVVSVTSFLGASVPRFSATYAPKIPLPTSAQMIVKTQSNKATIAILEEYETRMEHLFPQAMLRFKQMDYQMVDAPLMVSFKGEDRDALYPVADALRAKLNQMPTLVRWVHADNDNIQPLVTIALDQDEAARLGVNRTLLSLELAGTFNGLPLTKIWEGDRAVPVTLYGEGIGSGMPYSVMGDQLVTSAIPGVSIPLRQVASIRPDAAPAQLERRGGEPSVTVYADLLMGRKLPEAMKHVKAFVGEQSLPEGARVEYEGLSTLNSVLGPEIGVSFFVACLILFLFLLVHFKKASIALLTMAMSSICLFGASLGLWLFNLDFGMTAALGLISLVGIVVRNGILMYEYAEERRFKDGMDVRSASIEAGKRRVRPILLTSCTTALGVLPMILSGDILWQPMGVIICFGTILSIFLIVLVMPVSYYLAFRKS